MPASDAAAQQQLRAYFAEKPRSFEIFTLLSELIEQQGECEVSVGSQISFGSKRKFAWIWLYNITGKNPQGTVQIMLAMDEKIEEPPVYRVTAIGKRRWNHLVVVHSLEEARDPKLHRLIERAYRYGST
ncbi:DUF5655 domain-containing protein [Nocardia goodfellowii]